ncbi:hypothetical protein HORIV_16370 [Vreelandella olivaria]|uniref:Amidohydrolase 3 domain-containing protein n=1 Tax=Vreelandella olivaria TaxID=390919 RepID=A0ABM7GF70_9GAMM|nr:hypothetical protein HORIV_16370 [Halomonas olivaria]
MTTLTDLYNPLSDDGVASMQRTCNRADVPMRLAPAMSALTYTPEEGIERLLSCLDKRSDKLHFGLVKLMTDGSIQGYTARLKWPGYHDGSPNGMWNAEPERLTEIVHRYHQAGLQLHIHTNGDEAIELILDAIESALELWPRADHRHTLQHCQIISHAQLKRAARLGCVLTCSPTISTTGATSTARARWVSNAASGSNRWPRRIGWASLSRRIAMRRSPRWHHCSRRGVLSLARPPAVKCWGLSRR